MEKSSGTTLLGEIDPWQTAHGGRLPQQLGDQIYHTALTSTLVGVSI